MKTCIWRETGLNPGGLEPPRSKPGGYHILDVMPEGDEGGARWAKGEWEGGGEGSLGLRS